MTDQEVFEANRELLFAVAYRMLGSVADAEDAVQDAWLRWSAAPRSDIAQPRAYLARTVTHIALNKLRSARARREAYVGPWLPEPMLTTGPDTADRTELAESVSLAMLVVLESLTPEERAVFVLHECSVSRTPRSPPRSAAPTPRSGSSCTGRASMSRRAGHGSTWTQASSAR